MRKKRLNEITCTCKAYKFPHRLLGGNCTGRKQVIDTWETRFSFGSICTHCQFADFSSLPDQCQILEGLDDEWQCEGLLEYIRVNVT